MPNSGYDIIAHEYYEVGHKTCRNFDRATSFAFDRNPFSCNDGKVLEVGAGRGRANEYLNIESSRIVQLDSSLAMLDLENREPCYIKILADACDIPLSSNQFRYVVGFLVDAFFGLKFLSEAYRVLEYGGELLITMPTKQWGDTIREKIQLDVRSTRFKKIDSEEVVILPSILNADEKIIEMLECCGFNSIKIEAYPLAEGDNIISNDIAIVADTLEVPLKELNIISIVTAKK